MKRKIIISALSILAILIVGLGVYWFRIPTTKYLKLISMKGWVLPEEVSVPYRDPPFTNIPMYLAQKEVDGDLIPQKVHSKEDALMAVMYVRSYYRIPNDAEFACVLDETDSGVNRRILEFLQLYKGVPVQNGYFKVGIYLETEELQWIDGCYESMDDIDIDVKPTISAYKARQLLGLELGQRIESAQLMVFVYPGRTSRTKEPRLGWEIYTTGSEIQDHKLIYVDAKTGEIMHSEITMKE